jgi:hypothetical protein
MFVQVVEGITIPRASIQEVRALGEKVCLLSFVNAGGNIQTVRVEMSLQRVTALLNMGIDTLLGF